MTPPYAELQCLTNFSFLRGGSHGEELVARAQALGLAALAVTDHNTLAGVVRAHLAAKQAGLQFIPAARLDLRDALSLLAYPTDRRAWGRLCRLLTLGQRRADKGQCDLALDDLAAHAEGMIFVAVSDSPLPGGERSTAQRSGEGDQSRGRPPLTPALSPQGRGGIGAGSESQLRRLKEALDAPLYLAASYLYRGDDRARIAALDGLARACGTPLVATNAVLYHTPERRPLQDVLTCIREKCTLSQAGLRLQANAERHLKSAAEMARLFAGFEGALERTVEIAESYRFSLDELVYEYPDEPVPDGKTPQEHLENLTWAGARWRFPDGVPAKVKETLARELALIAELNYAPYFLTVHDIVQFARSRGILCQGRGSAANSAVCYCLAITSVNPAEIDLLFERFVSPERNEPPDIDVDFEHERREEVIQYIYGRYGRERAALAATVISYRRRSAVREVGKAMGLSEDTVAALARTVWHSHEGGILPDKHVREAGLDPADPLLARTLVLAAELMGFPRHLSQHVGGFVLTRGPLCELVPIANAAMEDRTVIEWDKDDLDALGLLKVDVLGLGMLTCIRKCFALLEAHYGRALTLATVPREDAATYDMLCKADSIGVFQVESRAQMNMLPRLKPRRFYDLVIEVAIVRPGPIQGDMVHPYLRRRDGLEPVDYPQPGPEHGPPDELKDVLEKTLGVPLFQEQAMRIAIAAARFTPDEANQLRHAMATFRRRGTINRLRDKFIGRMVARGYAPEIAERCFKQIEGFGEYGFPESHSASFSLLVYISAWLKCHYPAVFACALLNSQPMGFYAPAQIVGCARAHGVEVRPVDVNHSDWDCTLEPGKDGAFALRLGFRQVDGLKEAEAERIVVARSENLPLPGGERSTAQRSGEGDQSIGLSPLTPTLSPQGRGGMAVPRASSLPVAFPPDREWHPFHSPQDLHARAGVRRTVLERLAAADAFRSMGLDRRQALWRVRALADAPPLPLFEYSRGAEGPGGNEINRAKRSKAERPPAGQAAPAEAPRSKGEEGLKDRQGSQKSAGIAVSEIKQSNTPDQDFLSEPDVQLPQMPLAEHVVHDYQTLRLSLKAHPMRFLREACRAEGARACAEVRDLADGAPVTVAGVVLVRQRPGSARGVVFMTLEDETGVANAVIWPKTLEAYRPVVMGARLVWIRGRIQRHEDIIHVVAQRLEDRSHWLALLAEGGLDAKSLLANADEVRKPDPGSWRPTRAHPRSLRIIPKSRDFH